MFLKKDHFNGLLVVVVILSIVSGFLGGALTVNMMGVNNAPQTATYDSGRTDGTRKTVYIEQSSIIDTVKKVSPAVVSVVVSKDLPTYKQGAIDPNTFFFGDPFSGDGFNSPFTQPQYDTDGNGKVKTTPQKIGGGSGFIVTKDGLILTNKHVVEDTQADYSVVLNDGTEYPADVVSRDTLNDIAVLKIKKPDGKSIDNLPVVTLGNSSDLQVGQQVVAIGNALAEYDNSVTMGVISAKGRSINAGDINGGESLINLLQTDASINPGNSGGPLVNLNGEVIGINVAIANGAQGIGFALAIDDVKPIINGIKENGKIVRPFLGVRYMLLDKQKADELKINVEGGALLVGDEAKGEFAVIPGSPADKAGLKMKDVILEADDKKITAENNLQNLIANKNPGDKVSLKVWRSGKEMNVDVTLDEAK
jgi:serine protease Do